MRRLGACATTLVLVLAGLQACSPALDWRQAELEGLQVLMPCRPKRASREVTLANTPLTLQAMACEADGQVYAVTSVAVPPGVPAEALRQEWERGVARSAGVQHWQAWEAPLPIAAPKGGRQGTGVRADGSAQEVRLHWTQQGTQLSLLAWYGPASAVSATDMFWSAMQWTP